MRFSIALIAAIAAATGAEASVGNAIRRDDGNLAARHVRLGRRQTGLTKVTRANSNGKRCKAKTQPANNTGGDTKPAVQGAISNSGTPAATSGGNAASSPAAPAPAAPSSNPAPKTSSNSGNRLLQVASTCGDIGATVDITPTTGPNGSQDWMNCGISGGGWSPPDVKISDLVSVDLRTNLQSPGSPFAACSAFIDQFENYANQHGFPPIILASFAMQESGCNPGAVGGGGEQGLMQITQEKCGGAPGGNCQDPDYNIRTGAQYFADSLAGNGGNVFKTVGQYNGYFPGMTFGQATAAANSGCCKCQNNLDYLTQFFNGWLQGADGHSLGVIKNLAVCG